MTFNTTVKKYFKFSKELYFPPNKTFLETLHFTRCFISQNTNTFPTMLQNKFGSFLKLKFHFTNLKNTVTKHNFQTHNFDKPLQYFTKYIKL